MPRRAYRSDLRVEQTAALRRRLLDVAATFFVERGYLGTTIAEIARTAAVSPQTVYNVVGGKPDLLKAAYDRAIAGDDEPVPMRERPLIQAMIAAEDPAEAIGYYARLAREIAERSHRLVSVALAQATSGDPALAEFAAALENERSIGARATAHHLATRFGLPEGITEQEAADVLWATTALDLATRLVTTRNWDWDRYQSWIAHTMTTTLVRT